MTPDEEFEHRRALDRAMSTIPGECVLCYVARMLAVFGCDGTLRWAVRWWIRRAPRANLAPVLDVHGDYCDCEVFRTGWRLARELRPSELEAGVAVPRCTRPRLVSEACDNWMGRPPPVGRWA
jgi:hypothetical protein